MSPIKKVFMIIGTLVIILMIWQLVFNDGGIIRTGYTAVTAPINKLWGGVTGNPDNKILPAWDGTNVVKQKNDGVTW
jgi:hypothetical protein